GLRKTESLQSQRVRLRALNLSRSHCLARANRSHLFIQLGPDRILAAFAKRREQTDRMRSIFVPHHDERRAVFIVRMGRDAHHRPRILKVEQRLIEGDATFGSWLSYMCGLRRTGESNKCSNKREH